LRDADEDVITFWESGPQPLVEHPVGVGGVGEAIAGIVVAADGVLVKRHKTKELGQGIPWCKRGALVVPTMTSEIPNG